jgi:hypothetical protein
MIKKSIEMLPQLANENISQDTRLENLEHYYKELKNDLKVLNDNTKNFTV